MTDCDICVSNFEGDGRAVYFGCRRARSRKPRPCGECGSIVPPGSQLAYHRGNYDGHFWQVYCCLVCDEIADAFSCNGRQFGTFWESMSYLFDEAPDSFTTACFDRLSTVAAKVELQRRINQWRGLHP